MQLLSLYSLPSPGNDIIKRIKKGSIDTHYSRFYNQPQIQNGFNKFIHRTKDKMAFVLEPEFKGKNFYHVTNPFEHIINNRGDRTDIANYSKLYFGIEDGILNITSRAFYKLWEMLMIFDTMPKKGSVVTAHLAEAPGSFVQATMFYREKFFKEKDYSKDEHFTISLDDPGVPAFKRDFRKAYKRVKIYEQDGGDLTDIQSINKFNKFSKKADFITADGGFEWRDENYQEQEAYRLLLGEIITALKVQKEGGTFIIKLFEVYTDLSIKMLSILSALYDNTYMFKPYTSRPSNSERYMVCKGFKGVDNAVISNLEILLEDMNRHETDGRYIIDFLEDFEINSNYKHTHNVASIMTSSNQFVAINRMVDYVHSNNFYGDEYHKYLRAQQDANDYWARTFYPIDKSDLTVVQKDLDKLTKSSLDKTNDEIKTYVSSLYI
jgi:23S rRNA U2552 (ribose-2'-O)-methylase RlmE/FtsJ